MRQSCMKQCWIITTQNQIFSSVSLRDSARIWRKHQENRSSLSFFPLLGCGQQVFLWELRKERIVVLFIFPICKMKLSVNLPNKLGEGASSTAPLPPSTRACEGGYCWAMGISFSPSMAGRGASTVNTPSLLRDDLMLSGLVPFGNKNSRLYSR